MTVTAALCCWIAGIVSSLVGLSLLLTSPIWTQALEYAERTGPGEEIPALLNLFKYVTVFVFLLGAGLYLFFALKMFGGRNWARITLTVFGALSAISASTPVSSTLTFNGQTYSLDQTPSYITAVLAVAGIVLMYIGGANRYFAASLAFRQSSQLTQR